MDLASVKARLPFLHFFDGYRTSAEMQKIDVLEYEQLAALFPHDALQKNLTDRSLNPSHPKVVGTQMRPDIYFQHVVAGHKYHVDAPAIVEQVKSLFSTAFSMFTVFFVHF